MRVTQVENEMRITQVESNKRYEAKLKKRGMRQLLVWIDGELKHKAQTIAFSKKVSLRQLIEALLTKFVENNS